MSKAEVTRTSSETTEYVVTTEDYESLTVSDVRKFVEITAEVAEDQRVLFYDGFMHSSLYCKTIERENVERIQ